MFKTLVSLLSGHASYMVERKSTNCVDMRVNFLMV